MRVVRENGSRVARGDAPGLRLFGGTPTVEVSQKMAAQDRADSQGGLLLYRTLVDSAIYTRGSEAMNVAPQVNLILAVIHILAVRIARGRSQ